MEATKVMTSHHPSMRAVVLCSVPVSVQPEHGARLAR
jgi:hypothetical protein